MDALTGVRLWDSGDSYNYLHMPHSTHDKIVRRHPGEEEATKRSLVSEFLNHHPLPSWTHIVKLIRDLEGERVSGARKGRADMVSDKYLKSELHIYAKLGNRVMCIYTCMYNVLQLIVFYIPCFLCFYPFLHLFFPYRLTSLPYFPLYLYISLSHIHFLPLLPPLPLLPALPILLFPPTCCVFCTSSPLSSLPLPPPPPLSPPPLSPSLHQ